MANTSVTSAKGNPPQLTDAWDLFLPSMRTIGRNFWTLVGLFAIPLGGAALTIVALYIMEKTHVPATPSGIVGMLLALGSIGSFAIVLPAANLALLLGARGQRVEIQEMLTQARPLIRNYLGTSILLLALCFAGIWLILPYLFVLQRFMLAPYYAVDHNVSPLEAFRMSNAASKKHSAAMWGIVGIMFCFDIIEFVPHVGAVLSIVFGLLYAGAPAVRYVEIGEIEARQSGKKKRKKSKKSSTFANQFDGKSTID